ncbi:hypothetical protein K501DRAFT_274253 [Backusella circina FSU 941]|nr:hypothetical protein K501DRAFT_274253 [Backusella circina FSU 941]
MHDLKRRWVYSEIGDAIFMVEQRVEKIVIENGQNVEINMIRGIVTRTEEEAQIGPKEMNQKRLGIAENNLYREVSEGRAVLIFEKVIFEGEKLKELVRLLHVTFFVVWRKSGEKVLSQRSLI